VKIAQEHMIPKMRRGFRHEHIKINEPVVIEPPK
jgi:hypothetical protein